MKWIRKKNDDFEREFQEKIELVRADYQEELQEEFATLELSLQKEDPLEEAETFLKEVKRRYRKPVRIKKTSHSFENKVKEITEELKNLYQKHNFTEKRLQEHKDKVELALYEEDSLEKRERFSVGLKRLYAKPLKLISIEGVPVDDTIPPSQALKNFDRNELHKTQHNTRHPKDGIFTLNIFLFVLMLCLNSILFLLASLFLRHR